MTKREEIEKIETYDKRRKEYLGTTTGEDLEIHMKLVRDLAIKVNEIIDLINKK